jgi:UDP-GlcNAc:undecaprenyl-phosphate/decaprenyl-phosphate GlcNAc-1-phosphate transferase
VGLRGARSAFAVWAHCCFTTPPLMLWLILTLIAVAFAVSLPATWLARGLGRRLQAMDGAGVAGQVKAPPRRVPNTGGVGIFAGIAAPMVAGIAVVWFERWEWVLERAPALAQHLSGIEQMLPSAGIVLGCLTVLHLVGLVDDRRPMGAMVKLGIMLVIAALAVVGTESRLLTLLDDHVGGRWLSIGLSVLWIVVVTNAFNFLDNMDGLSGGVGAICGAAFLTAALVGSPPQWFIAATLALLVGSLLGFLVFNFPFAARRNVHVDGHEETRGGASIFMGDSGSLVIGFLLALLSVRLTYVPTGAGGKPAGWHLPIIPLIILAIPLYDFCSVVVLRLRQGKSPFVGDLQHFSHRLCRHGLSPRSAVLVIYGCALITCIGAIAMPRLEPWQGVLVGVQTLLVLAVLAGYEWARTP